MLSGIGFSLYVTNLDLPLDQIWYIYNTRADCENRIKELKQDFGLDAFCLQELTRSPPHGSLALRAALRAVCLAARRAARLWATEASFRFIMVAYNLMSLFRHFGLNSHNQATLAMLRSYCFAIGGWVRQHARKRVLKLSLPGKNVPGWTLSSAKSRLAHRRSLTQLHNPGSMHATSIASW
ncbi:MAG: hypothetical protein IPK32_02920 [Verrucomicrobiaceae bacterium]|nr:hypothetical protein [Verrucomicrobiaceae bacterium]